MIRIAPSILSADFSVLGETVKRLEKSGADMIHCDVMDGSFVPAITFGAKTVKDIKKHTNLPMDVHLMVANPFKHIEAFAKSGADIITFHLEADDSPFKTLELIKSYGVKCGVVVNPYTPIDTLFPYLKACDMVLIMSVVAGKGGQEFIPETLPRLKALKERICNEGLNVDIEVDGGVTLENVRSITDSGANIIVAGSTIFSSDDIPKTIKSLRNNG